MSEHDATVDPGKPEHKLFGKHRWRGKLFSSEEKGSKEERQGRQVNDVVEFLQTPGKRNDSFQKEPSSTSYEDRLPEAPLPQARPSSSSGQQPTNYFRRKTPRRQGLQVTFDSAPPLVIGVGGDEAELPSSEVRRSLPSESLRQQPHVDVPQYFRRPSPPLENAPNLRWSLRQGIQNESNVDDDDFSRPPLRKQSTGYHGFEPQKQPAISSREIEHKNLVVVGDSNRKDSLASPVSDAYSDSFAAIYASYGQDSPVSPHIHIDHSAPQLEKPRLLHKDAIEDLKSFSSLNPFSPESEAFLGNSLTPIPSPQPITTQAAQSLSYNFPTSTTRKHSPSQAEAAKQIYPTSSTNESANVSPPDTSSRGSPKKPPPMTLRNVAKNLGEDAFNEFTARVQRFNAIFRLGAAAKRPFEATSVTQWMRAGAWWFIKGRGELENAVRGRPSSREGVRRASEGHPSSELKQAYLNLAKACWILLEIVLNHEELKKYGDASIGSLSPIVKSFGDNSLAEMLDLHQAIIANMRALTMSMRRNDKMPPEDFEPQGLDSRIWIETPRFASGVAGILAGSSSRTLLEDGSPRFDAFPYPVGDTPRHFNFGSMFVDVVLRSSADSQEGVHLPCILSVLRPRNDRDLEVVLANQDGQVNIVIQSDRRAGPVWRDAQWRTKNFVLILKVADGLDLEMHFLEQNFRTLWGIYDYTRKVRKEMEPGEAEKIVFGSTVRCVHYVDPPDAKSFPPSPVRSCDLLLFEKTLTVAEGTGRRRFYDGHRLAIITPPVSKTLSSINQSLGKQTPILSSYVKGEDGGPALLLKTEAAQSTLVITFEDPESRDNLQALLDGTILKHDEISTEVLPLTAVNICTFEDEPPSIEQSSLSDWRWQQLRIINQRPELFDNGLPKTVLSESLRIWMQGEAGTFLDRINLGNGPEPRYSLNTADNSAGQAELQIQLTAEKPLLISICRPPQQDVTVSFASNLVSANKSRLLDASVHKLSTAASVRSYAFKNMRG